jgi:hypothetical protein
VHELSCEQSKTTKELLDIATRHASGEEAVEAIFMQSSGKVVPGDGRGASTTTTDKGTKRGIKSDKKGPRWRAQQVVVTASCGEDNIGKDVSDSDEELIAADKRDFKHQAWLSVDHLKKLLQATCHNHTYPIKHKLKECTMIKNYMTTGNLARSKNPEGDSTGKAVAPPEEKAVMSIYGAPPRVTLQAQAHWLGDQLHENVSPGVPALV